MLQEMLSRLRQSHFAIHAANVGEESDPALRAECQDGSCGLDVRVLGDQAVVFRVAEGSTAQRCGIREGWCIRRINGSGIGAVLSDVKKKFRSSTRARLSACMVRDAGTHRPSGRERPHRFSRRKRSCSLCSRSLRLRPGHKFTLTNMPPRYVHFQSHLFNEKVGYVTFNTWGDALSNRKNASGCEGVREFGRLSYRPSGQSRRHHRAYASYCGFFHRRARREPRYNEVSGWVVRSENYTPGSSLPW